MIPAIGPLIVFFALALTQDMAAVEFEPVSAATSLSDILPDAGVVIFY